MKLYPLYNKMSDNTQHHLSQLGKTIQARKNLRNIFQEKQLMNLGLYEQAARIQEPITKTIIETTTETKKELEKVHNAIEQQRAANQPLSQHAVPLTPSPRHVLLGMGAVIFTRVFKQCSLVGLRF